MSPDAVIMQQTVLQEVISNQRLGIRSDVSWYSKAVVSSLFAPCTPQAFHLCLVI